MSIYAPSASVTQSATATRPSASRNSSSRGQRRAADGERRDVEEGERRIGHGTEPHRLLELQRPVADGGDHQRRHRQRQQHEQPRDVHHPGEHRPQRDAEEQVEMPQVAVDEDLRAAREVRLQRAVEDERRLARLRILAQRVDLDLVLGLGDDLLVGDEHRRAHVLVRGGAVVSMVMRRR
ncbi:MAG: hypothetical protein WDN72_09635 [Alphaproteobacteria bacterium]